MASLERLLHARRGNLLRIDMYSYSHIPMHARLSRVGSDAARSVHQHHGIPSLQLQLHASDRYSAVCYAAGVHLESATTAGAKNWAEHYVRVRRAGIGGKCRKSARSAFPDREARHYLQLCAQYV
jgi:hypothetical protein